MTTLFMNSVVIHKDYTFPYLLRPFFPPIFSTIKMRTTPRSHVTHVIIPPRDKSHLEWHYVADARPLAHSRTLSGDVVQDMLPVSQYSVYVHHSTSLVDMVREMLRYDVSCVLVYDQVDDCYAQAYCGVVDGSRLFMDKHRVADIMVHPLHVQSTCDVCVVLEGLPRCSVVQESGQILSYRECLAYLLRTVVPRLPRGWDAGLMPKTTTVSTVTADRWSDAMDQLTHTEGVVLVTVDGVRYVVTPFDLIAYRCAGTLPHRSATTSVTRTTTVVQVLGHMCHHTVTCVHIEGTFDEVVHAHDVCACVMEQHRSILNPTWTTMLT